MTSASLQVNAYEDTLPAPPTIRTCRGCGWRFHAVPGWHDPRCIACRYPTYRRKPDPSASTWTPAELARVSHDGASSQRVSPGRSVSSTHPPPPACTWHVGP